MGNISSQTSKRKSKLAKFIKSKLSKSNKNNEANFIIKHCQNNKNTNESMNIESFDQRRIVFVSLLGIYQSWRRVPSVVLYSAILLMPLKSKWIYSPSSHTKELQSHFVSKFSQFYDVQETSEFIQLLKWKDSQGLVVWMLDDYFCYKVSSSLIDPFWYYLSNKISNLYDPISKNKYNKLNLNENWWQNKNEFVSKYNTKSASIMSELYFVTMKFNTIQEILFQSNSNLNPIKTYNNIADKLSMTQTLSNTSVNEINQYTDIEYVIAPNDLYIDDEEKGDFVFACDYEAYCMDTNDNIDDIENIYSTSGTLPL